MAFTRGKHAKAISDRSGMEFPYNEMVKEWNGHFVHKSEYEEKHPQLELRSSGNITNTENFYHFTVDTNTATTGGISGGGNSCSAGPATLTA